MQISNEGLLAKVEDDGQIIKIIQQTSSFGLDIF